VLVRQATHERASSVDAWDDALRLRELLKFEFFFAGREQFAKDLWAELALVNGEPWPPDRVVDEASAQALLALMEFRVSPMILRPFLDAYAVLAHQLLDYADEPVVDTDALLARCLLVGQQWALQKRISSEESVSSEMFQTALRLAVHRGLLEAATRDRLRFAEEIDEVRDRIARVESTESFPPRDRRSDSGGRPDRERARATPAQPGEATV
jgi:glycerol-3-phosphate O-acyltransferase